MSSIPSVGLSVLPKIQSVRKVYCGSGKTADWIRMPFGMVSGVGREMGVLDKGGDRRREGAVLRVNFGRPTGTLRRGSSQIALDRTCLDT